MFDFTVTTRSFLQCFMTILHHMTIITAAANTFYHKCYLTSYNVYETLKYSSFIFSHEVGKRKFREFKLLSGCPGT